MNLLVRLSKDIETICEAYLQTIPINSPWFAHPNENLAYFGPSFCAVRLVFGRNGGQIIIGHVSFFPKWFCCINPFSRILNLGYASRAERAPELLDTHQLMMYGPCVFTQVQSEFLSTALAIAALRRCFGPTSALVVTWINRLFQIRDRHGKCVCIF